jgi:lysophospholipase L1-like esterase
VLIRFATLAVTLFFFAACSGETPIQPPPPPPPPEGLQISCPALLTAEATKADGADITFDAPITTGGREPYVVECAPKSGDVFPVGESSVKCTATDSANVNASCGFGVRITVSQNLSKTRFVAFGDSITSGVVSLQPLIMLDGPDTYPSKLERLLMQSYPTQAITVVNRGQSGERTDRGAERLPSVLDVDRPEVLLIFEGTNAVQLVSPRLQERYLGDMIEAAQDRGVDVVIATVMPISAEREERQRGDVNEAIRDLNQRIIRLAFDYRLGSPVDLFGIFDANPGLLGSDGLHPTLEGQTRIAEAFRDAIVQRYGRRTGGSTMSSRFSTIRRP